ncbi:hypothetical protein Tco_0859567 [Tanacetum coccineum]|uniref:Uncharacterized protein n=1 Tax=Tanacetum coccineum TaxID=301880 RepID=A0ABQ5BCC3_9ASTR
MNYIMSYNDLKHEVLYLTSLGVTSEERAYPQLSSGMSAFNLNKPIFSASFIIHYEFASRCDASADSTAEADHGLSAPNDSIPQQQGMDERTKKTSFNHISVGEETSFIARQVKEEESSRTIKLEDLAKLVLNVQTSFKDLDSPKDDHVIVVDNIDEDEEDEVHTTTNDETEDTSAPKFLIFQLNELLVKSLQTKFSKILSAYDFSSSLPTELKDISSKFNELTEEVKGLKKQVYEFEIKLLGDLKEIPTKLEDFTKTVTDLTSQVAELKTLHPPKSSSQPEGDHIKKDKGKKAMYSEEVEKKSTNNGSNDDETHVIGSMVKSSSTKKLKKFDFITEDGRHIHLIEE